MLATILELILATGVVAAALAVLSLMGLGLVVWLAGGTHGDHPGRGVGGDRHLS